MSEPIPVGMGEIRVSTNPNTLAVYGVGSCVIVALYDSKTKTGGIAHVMLPDSSGIDKEKIKPGKFADTAIPELFKQLSEKEIFKSNVEAKIVGGSIMFPPTEDFSTNIGEKNTIAVREALERIGIPISAEDIGGNRGRSIEFDLDSGIIRLSVLGENNKEI